MLDHLELAHPATLKELLGKTQSELEMLQPRIEALETQMAELRELKFAKQRLITLKMSLVALLENDTKQESLTSSNLSPAPFLDKLQHKFMSFNELSALKNFYPDKAFQEVDQILKHKHSLNYEMFKAVVFHGGKATTEAIKAFLVNSGIQQPQSGQGFENVPLSEISSRANYLVRKGILFPDTRGSFYTLLGWQAPDTAMPV